jgi:hypothetical protein
MGIGIFAGYWIFSIWGFMVVHSHNADKRTRRLRIGIGRDRGQATLSHLVRPALAAGATRA